jgi:hypothetical protein
MSVEIKRNELPVNVREAIAGTISSAIGNRKGDWLVDITSEPLANAWDVEVYGPERFHWARRFSAEDRDTDVIFEAVLTAVQDRAAA